jgi:hypothetical protein
MLSKSLNLITKEFLIKDSVDEEYKSFIDWLYEWANKSDDLQSVYATSVTIKKIERIEERSIEGLKKINSNTVNDLLKIYLKSNSI